MNNNYYNNPYVNPYYQQQVYQQPVQPQIQQVQQMQQMQQAQPHMIPMVYVNGLEGAKAFWMGTNSIAYLRDNNDDSVLYEKKTDAVGKYYIKGFKLTEMELDNNGGFKTQNHNDNIKALENKIDAIYAFIAGKNEVSSNEQ